MQVFDKAKYHVEGDFPADLGPEQALLPGGMFLAWCAQMGLLSAETSRDFAHEESAVVSRAASPCSLYRALGGVFTDAHLSAQGAAFARDYFDMDKGPYLDDYVDCLCADLPSAYHVADRWDSFDALAPIVDARFAEWRGEAGD